MVRMRGEPEANIFVATEDDAAKGASAALADGVNGEDLYGIYNESVAALHHVLLGREFDLDAADHSNVIDEHPEVYVYTELHGGWLHRFPDRFVHTLATLTEADRSPVAEKWSKVFEGNGEPPTSDEVVRMLNQMSDLAKSAINQKKHLYWRQESC